MFYFEHVKVQKKLVPLSLYRTLCRFYCYRKNKAENRQYDEYWL